MPANNDILALVINSSGHIFAGTVFKGVSRSINNGNSWTTINNGLYTDVRALAINANGYIFAGTYGGGVFRSVQSTTAVRTVTEFLSTFELAQNYPNPFNPSTRIRFTLPRASKVAVRVFDMSGREVATLLEGARAAGPHSLVWEGKNTAGELVRSGVYFLRLEAGGEVAVRKLALVR